MRRVVWSDAGRQDFKGIVRYVRDENPDAAYRIALRIEEAASALGHIPTGRPGRVAGTFEKVVPRLPYIIAYEILPGRRGEEIVILHVIHGAREWSEGTWPGEG